MCVYDIFDDNFVLYHVQDTRQKLDRVHVLKEDLKVNLAKLPDLSKLAPQGVAPLPDIGDLFN